uniref:BESS domain-containing protein n=1 Tax=Haemonchus contortus TaxID=6289 RepID=A0A7I4YUM1_HAECO
MEDHNGEDVPVPEADEDLFQMRREDSEDMPAQVRNDGIVSVHQPTPASTGLGTSFKTLFKKTRQARQYEFNGGLIDLLAPIAGSSQEGVVRGTLYQTLSQLQQRNETGHSRLRPGNF